MRRWPQGPLTRLLRHVVGERLTDSGKTLVWVGLLTMAAGGVTLQIQIYLIFCVVVALFAVSAVLARLTRPRLELGGPVPLTLTAGAKTTFPLTIRNHSRALAVDIVVTALRPPAGVEVHPAQPTRIPPVAAGQSVTVTRALWFPRRGSYTLAGWRQEGLFPWGLWRDIVEHPQPRTVVVHPRFHPLHALRLPGGTRHQPGGIALSSQVGDSTEFVGTRDYRAGDSPRHMHWKTWARLGRPAVKEFQEEYFCRVALLMDTFLPAPPRRALFARREPAPPRVFEAAVSVAAAVTDALSREEYVIDVFAAGPELYHMQSGRSLACLDNVLDILACLEPCHEAPFEKIAPLLLEHLDRVAATVVIALDWDDARERIVRTIRDHGSAAKLIVIRDGPPTRNLASAHALCDDVQQITTAQAEAGIELL